MLEQSKALEIRVDPSLPLWREVLVGADLLFLRLSPIYYGIGIPRGDGSPVIVIPGFLGNDLYMIELYNWLQRIGYRSYLSRIGQNAQCPEVLSLRLIRTIEEVYQETGSRVHLVGHSLGGVLARSVSTRVPEMVAQVITLASPFASIKVHPYIIQAKEQVKKAVINPGIDQGILRPNCYEDTCDCRFACALREGLPESMNRTAIYIESDGVVDWHSCVENEARHNIRVFSATHTGLVFSPDSYWVLGKVLSSY